MKHFNLIKHIIVLALFAAFFSFQPTELNAQNKDNTETVTELTKEQRKLARRKGLHKDEMKLLIKNGLSEKYIKNTSREQLKHDVSKYTVDIRDLYKEQLVKIEELEKRVKELEEANKKLKEENIKLKEDK